MYCTLQDIIQDLTYSIVAQLSNDNNPEQVNETVVNRYIQEASEIIDGYLRGRYPLPLTKEHLILKKLAVSIVKFELYKRRNKIIDNIQNEYNETLAILDKLQRGVILLDEGTKENRPSFYKAKDQTPVFDRLLLNNY